MVILLSSYELGCCQNVLYFLLWLVIWIMIMRFYLKFWFIFQMFSFVFMPMKPCCNMFLSSLMVLNKIGCFNYFDLFYYCVLKKNGWVHRLWWMCLHYKQFSGVHHDGQFKYFIYINTNLWDYTHVNGWHSKFKNATSDQPNSKLGSIVEYGLSAYYQMCCFHFGYYALISHTHILMLHLNIEIEKCMFYSLS